MAKKKAETKAEPESTTPEAAPATKPTISKANAVRAALAKGIDTPEDGVAFILKEFGIVIPRQMFSSYKTLEKTRTAKAAGHESNGITMNRPSRVTSTNGHGGNAAELARQVKHLVEAHGADAIKQMVDVFAN